MKTQQQYEFEQAIKSLDIQLQIFQNPKSNSKLTEDRLNEMQGMIKNVKNLYGKVEERMKANMRNRNYNQDDIKNKLKNYGDGLTKIKDRFRKLEDKIVGVQKEELIKNRSLNPGQFDELEKINEHVSRINNLNAQGISTLGIYNEIINETDRQNKVLDDMHNDAEDIDHELSMIDQLMRGISNRELLTKLILVALVFFLGLADFLILLVKLL